MTPGPKGTSTLATMHLQTILVTFVLWLDASIYIDKIMVFGPQPLGTSILLAAVTSILWTLDTPGAAIRRANHHHFHRFFPQYTSNYWEELGAIYGQYIYIFTGHIVHVILLPVLFWGNQLSKSGLSTFVGDTQVDSLVVNLKRIAVFSSSILCLKQPNDTIILFGRDIN